MKQNRVSKTSTGQVGPPRGRKVRTADCRNCLLLGSLSEAGLPAATIEGICNRMWLNRVRRRQILFTEGNRAAHLYAIRAGRVKLVKVDTAGHEHVVAILESGDLFGLEAVFGPAYSTGAEAMTDCELCSAGGDELTALMNEVPGVATDLARYLHHRLLRALAHQACMGAPTARAKLAAYLLDNFRRADSGDLAVSRELTLRELGGVLGLAPETVCRTLSGLRNERVLDIETSVIRIRDIASLRRAAGF